jgi:hypothetical protein
MDKIKELVTKWNSAINTNQTSKLLDLYTSKVDYYGKSISSADCISSKEKWLKANPGYKQELKHMSVYFPEGSENILIAEFDKIYMDKGTKTVTALLNFNLINGQWKITKETDVVSEVAAIKNSPVKTLPDGKYEFWHEYWMDSRNTGIAHDMVPYRFSLKINIQNNKITGTYSRYSGMMRSWSDYKIISGKIENGSINITTQYLGPPAEKFQFRIIDTKNIICVNKGQELYGKIMSK